MSVIAERLDFEAFLGLASPTRMHGGWLDRKKASPIPYSACKKAVWIPEVEQVPWMCTSKKVQRPNCDVKELRSSLGSLKAPWVVVFNTHHDRLLRRFS